EVLIERFDIKHRQFSVERLDFTSSHTYQVTRVTFRCKDNGQPGGDGHLRVRQVCLGLHFRRQVVVHHVAHHANDFAHLRVARSGRHVRANAFAKRVFIRKEASYESFVDNHDRSILHVVARSEVAPCDQGNAHHSEVIRQNHVTVNVRNLTRGCDLPFDIQVRADTAPAEWYGEASARGANSR